RAVGTCTVGGSVPTANDTMTFGVTTLSWKAAAGNENEITIGGTVAASCTNAATVINAHSVMKKLFSATSTATTVVVTCLTPGLVGNGIVFTESGTNTAMDGSGHLGGTTAGAGCGDNTLCRVNIGGTLF